MRQNTESQTRRQNQVMTYLTVHGSTTVGHLARICGVSSATMYRDVSRLEDLNLAVLHQGLVNPKISSTREMPPELRSRRSSAAKIALSEAASGLIEPGISVMFDDSSTILPLVTKVAQTMNVTAITNSTVASQILRDGSQCQIISIGGRYYPWARSHYGSIAVSTVHNLHADICFMSDAAVDGAAIYNPTDYVVDLKRAMLRQSDKRVLLVDAAKFTRRSLLKTADLREFDTIFVSSDTAMEHQENLRQHCLDVRIVPVEHA